MTTRNIRTILSALVLIPLIACTGSSQAGAGGQKILATVNGEPVSDESVRQAATVDLEGLEIRKAQALIGFQRDEQTILERNLTSVVDNRIIELEAKKQGIAMQMLILNEVEKKVKEPTDVEVTTFYEGNKARINVTGDEATRQIRQYLRQQNRDIVYQAFIARLRNDFKVVSYLEPLRTPVAAQGFPTKGPDTAPVTIVEFSDFECPYCAAIFPTLQLVEANYGDKVKVVFRQFPLTSIHPRAQKAAEAALCANEQKKFWELHDLMFKDNRNLEVLDLKKKAASLKLDQKAFDACLDSSKQAEAVQKDIREGIRVGVTGTPALFINGRFLNGAQPFNEIAKIIDAELKKK